jgi:hypothetical protein
MRSTSGMRDETGGRLKPGPPQEAGKKRSDEVEVRDELIKGAVVLGKSWSPKGVELPKIEGGGNDVKLLRRLRVGGGRLRGAEK